MTGRIELRGLGVSPGVALGRVARYEVATEAVASETPGHPVSIETEMERFQRAVAAVAQELGLLARRVADASAEGRQILEAQQMMAEDPILMQEVSNRIREAAATADIAVREVIRKQAESLQALPDEYFAARAQDVLDVGKRLEAVLGGKHRGVGTFPPVTHSVVVAPDLSPADTAAMRREHVVAMVTARGGKTSHTAILARSLGIPAVLAIGDADALADGSEVLVDGGAGLVVVNPSPEDRELVGQAGQELAARAAWVARMRDLPACTRDGHRVALLANIGTPVEVEAALTHGAEGIGLYRTEFLFIGRAEPPSEAEQLQAYRAVLAGMGNRPVVIRTLDVGGDKDLPYLGLPAEANPFLGYRGIRICLERRDLFRLQLRALLQSAPAGELRIMLPMVIGLEEVDAARALVELTAGELAAEGVNVPAVPLGIMIETPAAAMLSDALARRVSFFSLGTNDLTQYSLAVDRGNEKVNHLYDPLHPGLLRLIARTVDAGRVAGIEVGVCGEMAGMPLAVPLLIGMGVDELSMSPPSLPRVKEALRSLTVAQARQVAARALTLPTAAEIRELLAKHCPEASRLEETR